MRREDNIPKRMHDPLFPLKVDGPARKELNLTESMFQAALQESLNFMQYFLLCICLGSVSSSNSQRKNVAEKLINSVLKAGKGARL